ncbi:MAG: hypothetical protein SGJ27_18395 [Candidatus Melainabacteria bacterium]|nr:hypothetical protein [Candidatus Melainabacteria bacterium]
MVGTDIKASLKNAVDAALSEKNPDLADQKYIDILQLVRMQVGDAEADIANALQAVAKQLEDDGRKEHAFDFKQKTCIMLLEFTMMPMPPLPKEFAVSSTSAMDDPCMKLVLMIHYVNDLDAAKKHYSKTLQAIVIDDGPEFACVRTAHGAQFLLVKSTRAETFPAFEALLGKIDALEYLTKEGWKSEGTAHNTPCGRAQVYLHPELGKLALIE